MDIFENATVQAPAQEAEVKTNSKKEKVAAMKEALRTTIQTNPEFHTQLRRLSNSVKVVNTLGYGTKGNIYVDKNSSKERDLKPTSAVCGYAVQNIGNEPIEYKTEVFAKDETGKFVGTVVTKTVAPGETIYLTRQYMTMFCAIPEISFTLANGKIVSNSKKKVSSIKDELSAYYFSFNKEEGVTVNDDEVKLRVDDANGVVKPEYEEIFGFLNNPKERKKDGIKKSDYTVQDMAANFVNQLLKNQGEM